MKLKVIFGFLFIIIGLILFFWIQDHSPYNGIGNKLINELSGSYTLSKQSYSISMIISAVLIVFGLYKIFKK
ncbi:MAG: hypothetical protein ABFR32_12105 [Bacteroidota bacterium]